MVASSCMVSIKWDPFNHLPLGMAARAFFLVSHPLSSPPFVRTLQIQIALIQGQFGFKACFDAADYVA